MAVQTLTEKLVTALTPAATAGWRVTSEVYQVRAVQHLVYGGIALLCFLAALWALRSAYGIWAKTGGQDVTEEDGFRVAVRVIPGVLAALISLLFMLCTLPDIWYWVALFHPQLYAAHEILQAVAQRQ